jgi:hypothetical protein
MRKALLLLLAQVGWDGSNEEEVFDSGDDITMITTTKTLRSAAFKCNSDDDDEGVKIRGVLRMHRKGRLFVCCNDRQTGHFCSLRSTIPMNSGMERSNNGCAKTKSTVQLGSSGKFEMKWN